MRESMEAADQGEAAGIPRVTTEEVLERLEQALAGWGADQGPPALATDADHTLWDGDVGFDIFEALLADRGVRSAARDALAREAESCGLAVRPEDDAPLLAEALYEEYKAGRYDEERAFGMMAWAFAGWTAAELCGFVDRVFEARALPARIRAGMRAVLAWARERGVRVLVVSASPQLVVERAVARMGVAAEQVTAMRPRVEAGAFRPELAAPPTYGDGKVRAVERALGDGARLIAAFGDSAYDAAMMRLAAVPVAVTPSPKLLALCDTLPGVVILEHPVAPAARG
ncbi:MAG TPA: HAD-IB family phosphatase [Candidatus Nanopelagicales bacterium]|nr:HAD-IB family phosphatase [Candidatus Nanopelagicales bacterium]